MSLLVKATGDNEVFGLLAAGLAANRPAAGIADRWYYSTDTKVLERDNGAAWVEAARGETAIRLAQLAEKAHTSLIGITADQHHARSHDHSLAADGSPIAVAGVPNLAASKITTDRFGMARMPDGTSGRVFTAKGAGADPAYADVIASIPFIIDGGGSAITTGQKGHLEIPFACTIQQVTLLADQVGSIVVDIWKDTYANFPPIDADSITASAPPTLSSAQKSQDSTLTGWTKSIAAGDILAFNCDSCTTITRVTVSLKVVKT